MLRQTRGSPKARVATDPASTDQMPADIFRRRSEVGPVTTAATGDDSSQRRMAARARRGRQHKRLELLLDASAGGLHSLRLPFPPQRLQIELILETSPEVSPCCLMPPLHTAICHGCTERPLRDSRRSELVL